MSYLGNGLQLYILKCCWLCINEQLINNVFQAVTSFKFFLSCSSISDVSLVSSTTSLATLVLLRGLEGAPLGLTLLPLLLFAVLEDIEDDLEEDVGDGEDLLSGAESPGSPSGGGGPTPVSGAGSSNRSDFLSWKCFEW